MEKNCIDRFCIGKSISSTIGIIVHSSPNQQQHNPSMIRANATPSNNRRTKTFRRSHHLAEQNTTSSSFGLISSDQETNGSCRTPVSAFQLSPKSVCSGTGMYLKTSCTTASTVSSSPSSRKRKEKQQDLPTRLSFDETQLDCLISPRTSFMVDHHTTADSDNMLKLDDEDRRILEGSPKSCKSSHHYTDGENPSNPFNKNLTSHHLKQILSNQQVLLMASCSNTEDCCMTGLPEKNRETHQECADSIATKTDIAALSHHPKNSISTAPMVCTMRLNTLCNHDQNVIHTPVIDQDDTEPHELQFVRVPVGKNREIVRTNASSLIYPCGIKRISSKCQQQGEDFVGSCDEESSCSDDTTTTDDDREEWQRMKQKYKNKFSKRQRRKNTNMVNSRNLSENLTILIDKACNLQRLKLELEEQTQEIQSMWDDLLREDLLWQSEDLLMGSNIFFDQKSTKSIQNLFNTVCDTENEVVNLLEDLIDLTFSSVKRLCKKNSINFSHLIEKVLSNKTNTCDEFIKKLWNKSNKILTNPSTTNNPSEERPLACWSFDHTTTLESFLNMINLEKRGEMIESIRSNMDPILELSCLLSNEDRVDLIETTLEQRFSSYRNAIHFIQDFRETATLNPDL